MRVAIRAKDLKVGDHTLGSGQEVLAVHGPFKRDFDRKSVMRVRLRRVTGKRVVERTADWNPQTTLTVERL